MIIGNSFFQLCLTELVVDTIQQNMHEIKCSQCGKAAFVPFKPTEGKPAYCKECFSNHNARNKELLNRSGNFQPKQVWARRRDNESEKKTVGHSVSRWVLSTKE